ncbi:unnamed protein product [Symbiodinium sp. CCMP2592]|nr:unnamed protein product [Symbiodinium sp. CCMP2592]
MESDRRDSKLQKLDALRRRVPAVSASALAGLLQDIEKNGLPSLKQRKHVKEATEHTVLEHKAYGPMIDSIKVATDEGEVEVIMANFFSLLQALFETSSEFQDLLRSSLVASGGQPLNLVFYSDEVTPGNVLSADTSRKLWAIYLSFMEFGSQALSKEEAWIPVLCQRSKLVNDLPGGAFLQDGLAHKSLFSIKGDNGTRCCLLCKNVISTNSIELEEARLVSDIYKEADLELSTDDDFAATVLKTVQKKDTLSSKHFQLWQQAAGLNFNDAAMIFDPDLCRVVKPTSQWLHDCMHTFLVKGIFNTIMHLMMQAAEEELGRDFYKIVHDYVKEWQLPKSRSENLSGLFVHKRKKTNDEAGSFKCRITSPGRLAAAIEAFLEGSIAAGWHDAWHPKFHWVVHLPAQLRKWGILPACWVQERKHKLAKRFGTLQSNTTNYERSILLQILGQTLSDIQQEKLFDTSCKLAQPGKAPAKMVAFLQEYMPGFQSIHTNAVAALQPAGFAHKGDLVLMKASRQVSQVYFHADLDGVVYSLVSHFNLVTNDLAHGSLIVQRTDAPMLVETSMIACPLQYTSLGGDKIRVLIPLAHRKA